MNHLIFSAVLTACLGIGGHQYSHQHGPYNKPPDEYFYKEPAQLYSSETYSWPTLVLPRSTQHVAIYTCIYYVLTYFAGKFGCYNVHAKVFQLMMTVYPIVIALTGFQVANLVPYFAKVLPQLLGLYICLPKLSCKLHLYRAPVRDSRLYKMATVGAPDTKKAYLIINLLDPMSRDITMPSLPVGKITYQDTRSVIIREFGSTVCMIEHKDLFSDIEFKTNETLSKFAN
ncbi:hypothetical protein DSO57_1010654 [Entomophthora muscae]|uniref:Uncharacterized protein n=1 Tax=Entomophthora muscae TaxID=34485 RepID=A0ACC2RXI8_9FUNG|nr:hypothetical protein DSO57_1010654 [Entomophthora muscae]